MKVALPYIFLVTFLGIMASSVIFLSRRLAWIFSLENLSVLYVGFTLVILFFLVATGAFINATYGIGHILFKTATVTMGIYLFLVMSFLVVDLINFIPGFLPCSVRFHWFGTNAFNNAIWDLEQLPFKNYSS